MKFANRKLFKKDGNQLVGLRDAERSLRFAQGVFSAFALNNHLALDKGKTNRLRDLAGEVENVCIKLEKVRRMLGDTLPITTPVPEQFCSIREVQLLCAIKLVRTAVKHLLDKHGKQLDSALHHLLVIVRAECIQFSPELYTTLIVSKPQRLVWEIDQGLRKVQAHFRHIY